MKGAIKATSYHVFCGSSGDVCENKCQLFQTTAKGRSNEARMKGWSLTWKYGWLCGPCEARIYQNEQQEKEHSR